MEIVGIGDEHTATGFRLAGVGRILTFEDGAAELQTILKDEQVGVLIVTERFAEENRKAVDDHKDSKRITPIVVEVPDVNGPIEREADPISELIKRAIGAEIK
ncbi:MAG: V-type ATP synthase subunit F [Deltaproteobacteria bacterium]|nr:V-type ATP synthase subunit F [Deltaproteobacteria bacterium]